MVAESGRSTTDQTWQRLEGQLAWYDRESASAQRAYKLVKVFQLLVTATIPVLASVRVRPWAMAFLGSVLLVLEGVQQLSKWQENWVLYRSTAEALKHERYLYLASAGPYSGPEKQRVLAERIEGLVSQEHAKWTESRQSQDRD